MNSGVNGGVMNGGVNEGVMKQLFKRKSQSTNISTNTVERIGTHCAIALSTRWSLGQTSTTQTTFPTKPTSLRAERGENELLKMMWEVGSGKCHRLISDHPHRISGPPPIPFPDRRR
jgi:hypothetical protein